MWRLLKTAIYVVGAYKLLGYKSIRKYATRRFMNKGRRLLPI